MTIFLSKKDCVGPKQGKQACAVWERTLVSADGLCSRRSVYSTAKHNFLGQKEWNQMIVKMAQGSESKL